MFNYFKSKRELQEKLDETARELSQLQKTIGRLHQERDRMERNFDHEAHKRASYATESLRGDIAKLREKSNEDARTIQQLHESIKLAGGSLTYVIHK